MCGQAEVLRGELAKFELAAKKDFDKYQQVLPLFLFARCLTSSVQLLFRYGSVICTSLTFHKEIPSDPDFGNESLSVMMCPKQQTWPKMLVGRRVEVRPCRASCAPPCTYAYGGC